MKKLITCLAAGLLIVGAQSLQAQSTNSSITQTPGTNHTQEQRKERAARLLKALGLTQADLKGLTREERQAKIKETAEQVVSDLKAKQTAGTLTAEEQKRLDFLEKFLAHAANKPAATPPSN